MAYTAHSTWGVFFRIRRWIWREIWMNSIQRRYFLWYSWQEGVAWVVSVWESRAEQAAEICLGMLERQGATQASGPCAPARPQGLWSDSTCCQLGWGCEWRSLLCWAGIASGMLRDPENISDPFCCLTVTCRCLDDDWQWFIMLQGSRPTTICAIKLM